MKFERPDGTGYKKPPPYIQVETTSEIIMSESKAIVSPVATLKDECGNVCQIIRDNSSYVICIKQEDETYKPTFFIFDEVFEVLKKLENPDAFRDLF